MESSYEKVRPKRDLNSRHLAVLVDERFNFSISQFKLNINLPQTIPLQFANNLSAVCPMIQTDCTEDIMKQNVVCKMYNADSTRIKCTVTQYYLFAILKSVWMIGSHVRISHYMFCLLLVTYNSDYLGSRWNAYWHMYNWWFVVFRVLNTGYVICCFHCTCWIYSIAFAHINSAPYFGNSWQMNCLLHYQKLKHQL